MNESNYIYNNISQNLFCKTNRRYNGGCDDVVINCDDNYSNEDDDDDVIDNDEVMWKM